MANDCTQQRRELYSKLSSQIALLDNVQLLALLDNSQSQNGWGKTQTLELRPFKVFLKRIPITDLEYANQFSTRNLYDLPMYYHYGVGSAGFGVFRELVTHIKTTNWVLEGAAVSFPLMYGYRILPTSGERVDRDQLAHQKYVDYWGGNANISRYMTDRENAHYELVIFLEHIPYTVGKWLPENPHRANKLTADMREAMMALRDSGILHLDAHFHNIVTDGEQFYLTDFGLALDREFEMNAEETDFHGRHTDYDAAQFLTGFGSHHQPNGLTEYLPLVTLMNGFYSQLRGNPQKDTPFDHIAVQRLLQETKFLNI